MNERPSVRAAKSLYTGARAPATDDTSINQILDVLNTRIQRFIGLGSIVKLDLAGEFLYVDGKSSPVTIQQSGSSEDCTVIVSKATLLGVATGKINPFAAFSDRRVKVEGRVEVAMKFSAMLIG